MAARFPEDAPCSSTSQTSISTLDVLVAYIRYSYRNDLETPRELVDSAMPQTTADLMDRTFIGELDVYVWQSAQRGYYLQLNEEAEQLSNEWSIERMFRDHLRRKVFETGRALDWQAIAWAVGLTLDMVRRCIENLQAGEAVKILVETANLFAEVGADNFINNSGGWTAIPSQSRAGRSAVFSTPPRQQLRQATQYPSSPTQMMYESSQGSLVVRRQSPDRNTGAQQQVPGGMYEQSTGSFATGQQGPSWSAGAQQQAGWQPADRRTRGRVSGRVMPTTPPSYSPPTSPTRTTSPPRVPPVPAPRSCQSGSRSPSPDYYGQGGSTS